MANKSSQSADWERTNTRAKRAVDMAIKAEPKTISSPANEKLVGRASAMLNKSSAKIAQLRTEAKKAALKKLGK
jgi:hypothetical protein